MYHLATLVGIKCLGSIFLTSTSFFMLEVSAKTIVYITSSQIVRHRLDCVGNLHVATADSFAEKGCQMECFQTKNINLNKFFEGICIENADIFYGRLKYFTVFWEYFMAIWQCCGNLVYFCPFWYFTSQKIWQPFCRVIFCNALKSSLKSR
jgi:hypothetical protein